MKNRFIFITGKRIKSAVISNIKRDIEYIRVYITRCALLLTNHWPMIKFFRKIRQNLLSEKKFSKYLTYAIGEIVLVVIGILIALSINNWNIEKQERKTEKINLMALQREFIQNKNILNEVIERNTLNIDGAKKLIESFKSGVSDTISEKTIAYNTYQAFGNEINFTPNTGVLSEIISSGELGLIQNQELKHKFAAFGSWIGKIKQQEGEVLTHRQNNTNYIIDHGNYKSLYTSLGRDLNWETPLDSVNNRALVSSVGQLNRILLFQQSSYATTRDFYLPLKEEIEKILELIGSELENK